MEKNESENNVFSAELVKAIDTVIRMQSLKQPQDKICLLWLLDKGKRSPKLVCFRKVLENRNIVFHFNQNLQISVTENINQFEDMIENEKRLKPKWESVTPPAQIGQKLLPLLNMHQDDPPKKEEIRICSLISFRVHSPFIQTLYYCLETIR